MVVLGVSGWKKSGKDTLADFLINKEGYERVAFADVLKEITAETYGLDKNIFYNQSVKEAPIKSLPVNPKDEFTKTIANFMEKEFRTEDGKIGCILSDRLYWTPRALLILEGSIKRAVNCDFWVQKTFNKIQEIQKNENKYRFVITDLRYKNEMESLVDIFGDRFVSCRVNRFETVDSTDPSERDLDEAEFDFTIGNRSSLDDFLEEVENLASIIEEYHL